MANTRNRVLETIADILDKPATSLPARVLRVAVTFTHLTLPMHALPG